MLPSVILDCVIAAHHTVTIEKALASLLALAGCQAEFGLASNPEPAEQLGPNTPLHHTVYAALAYNQIKTTMGNQMQTPHMAGYIPNTRTLRRLRHRNQLYHYHNTLTTQVQAHTTKSDYSLCYTMPHFAAVKPLLFSVSH